MRGKQEKNEKAKPLKSDIVDFIKDGNARKSSTQYIEGIGGLIDKYVLSSDRIPFLAVLAVMAYIFVQDNEAGRLQNWKDIFWTLQKCSVFLILYFILLLFRYACSLGKKLINYLF